jgi:hypothetical protein
VQDDIKMLLMMRKSNEQRTDFSSVLILASKL